MDEATGARQAEPQGTKSPRENNQLTTRQLLFINAYIQLQAQGTRGAGAKAAIEAGYSENGASSAGTRLLSNRYIAQAITQAQEEASAKAGISATYALDRLKIEAERTGEGSSHAARVQAAIAIGKTQGIFEADNKQRQPVAFHIHNRDNVVVSRPVIDITQAGAGEQAQGNRNADAPGQAESFRKADPLALGGKA